jgi:hypothetical protein
MAVQFSAISFIRNANGRNAKAGRATVEKARPQRKPDVEGLVLETVFCANSAC